MYAIVFKCPEGEQLLLRMDNGQFAIYPEKEDAVSALDNTLKSVNRELDGNPIRYGNSFWGYKTLRNEVSEERKETLTRLKNTIEIKQPDTLHFKDGTKLKGSK